MDNAFFDWFMMNGHGRYVWPAYGLTLALLVLLAIASWRARCAVKAALSDGDEKS